MSIRATLLVIATMLAIGIYSAPLRGQGLAEYGMSASRSASIGARMGSGIKGATPLASRVQQASRYPQSSIESNRRKLEEKGRRSGAPVKIESVPDKAAVRVDGALVAYTPTELTIPEGKHVIELKRPGFVTWRKEVSLNPGDSQSLKPELESQYKSSMILSIQK
jgi:hypothetical protein